MQESLLHYIWQFQYFDRADLKTTNNEHIQVLHPGFRNTHAGPDFSNARIKIGELEWVGSIEIHIHASGWRDHKHHLDGAYDNVILHVVWKDDLPVERKDQSRIPTIELKNRVAESLLQRYNKILLNPETIPCAQSLSDVTALTRLSMLEKALMNRLESKAMVVLDMHESNHHDWEETCYQLLCRNFGFNINSDQFLSLAKALPYKTLIKHSGSLMQVEALLFGQAGFLEDQHADEYYKILQREFQLLNKKFSLGARRLNKSQWKFLRLRPANFPTIRLAQLASIFYQQRNLFSKLIEFKDIKSIRKLFNVSQSDYWLHHYLFDKPHAEQIPSLGKMSIDNIIINTVIPLLVAYGKAHDDQVYIDRAVEILQQIGAEENMITKKWKSLGVTCKVAFDSQALIELYNNFCLRKRCLDCNIGSALIRPVLL